MKYGQTEKVFYCGNCGHIENECRVTREETAWGTGYVNRHGDVEADMDNSDINSEYYKCKGCNDIHRCSHTET